jgi:hypothetical protein
MRAPSHGEDGSPLKIPNLALIAIPLFLGGVLYRIALRLRYRLDGSKVLWFYQLYRHERVFDFAFRAAAKRAADDTASAAVLRQAGVGGPPCLRRGSSPPRAPLRPALPLPGAGRSARDRGGHGEDVPLDRAHQRLLQRRQPQRRGRRDLPRRGEALRAAARCGRGYLGDVSTPLKHAMRMLSPAALAAYDQVTETVERAIHLACGLDLAGADGDPCRGQARRPCDAGDRG